MIQAFNRSEIKAISKPLERLIRDIVDSIRRSLPDKRTEQIGTPTRMIRTPDAQVKSILKKPSEFESPAYGRGMHSVSDILDTELKQGSHPGPPVGSTVKKAQRKESEPKIFTAGPPR